LSSEPRVCILVERYLPDTGGTENQTRALARGLREEGIGVLVITRRFRRELPRSGAVEGTPVFRAPPWGRSSRMRWMLALTSVPILMRLRKHYDTILVSSFHTLGAPATAVARTLGKGCVLKADADGEMSGAFFQPSLAKLGLSRLDGVLRLGVGVRNMLLRTADAFVSLSSEMAHEFEQCGVDPRRIHTIPNAVDTENFHQVPPTVKQQLRCRLGLPRRTILGIYTGRLVTYKGLPGLLRVWKNVACGNEESCLVLVGEQSADIDGCEAELRRFVTANRLENRVFFAGHVKNVDEYLKASDFFVFPTENEAFGLSLVEAMACGLPVIATGIGGIKDIIVDRQNGLLIDPADADQLEGAIRLMLRVRDTVARLGREARKTVEEKYSIPVVARAYARLLRSVTAHPLRGVRRNPLSSEERRHIPDRSPQPGASRNDEGQRPVRAGLPAAPGAVGTYRHADGRKTEPHEVPE